MVIDQCWHRRGLASWERVDRLVLEDEATVVHRVLGRGTTCQCGSVRDDHDHHHLLLLGEDGVGVAGDDEVVRVPCRTVEVHPCMVHLEIRKLQSRH